MLQVPNAYVPRDEGTDVELFFECWDDGYEPKSYTITWDERRRVDRSRFGGYMNRVVASTGGAEQVANGSTTQEEGRADKDEKVENGLSAQTMEASTLVRLIVIERCWPYSRV